jgi:CDP-glycerol glycerophosphotransferase
MMIFCWNLFIHFPLDKKKVVFSNFNGGGYGDNPKFIAQEFLKRSAGWKLYWVSASDYDLPAGLTPVRPNTISFAWHMATAGTWVDDTRKLYYFKKRPEQFYIQTWHGGLGLKKVEKDCEEALSKEYVAYAKIDSRNMDLLLACCRWESDSYREAFWYDGPILERGIPKNDIYFEDPEPYRRKVLKHFHLPEDTKLVLYAPTYRDSRKTDMYNLDYEQLLLTMAKRFGGTWAVLVRMHPNVSYKDYPLTYTDRILNASPYENMQELLVASDVIISDYSGCAFDFPMIGKPGFLYAEDYEEMKRTKDYYFDLKDLPFTLALSNEELMTQIEHFDEADYNRKCKDFCDMLQFYDDGHASETVVDLIIERMQA